MKICIHNNKGFGIKGRSELYGVFVYILRVLGKYSRVQKSEVK